MSIYRTARVYVREKTENQKKEFVSFGTEIGLSEKACENIISKKISLESKYNVLIEESYLPDNIKENLRQWIRQRFAVLNQ